MRTQGIVIFDVDGTLSRTSEVDDDCWIETARSILGFESMSTDWSDYSHSTDEAIASDLIRDHHDESRAEVMLHRVRDDFSARIEAALAGNPNLFRPVPGAETIFEVLAAAGWASAIATGGWRRTAEMKLRAAGVPFDGVPAAHADDAHPREEIVLIAARRASSLRGRDFDRAVYVGDGVWDVRAADGLGIGFVGIGESVAADRLRNAGADIVFPDFLSGVAFLEAIEKQASGPFPGA